MSQVPRVDKENFETEVLQSSRPVLIDFWAEWCGPCLMAAPTIEKIAATYQGRVNVFKLNVDDNPDLAVRYEVFSIPCFILFKSGEAVDRIIGVMPPLEKHLSAMLERHLTPAA